MTYQSMGGISSPRSAAVDWALLALRAALGVIFIAHGAQKLFGWFGGDGLAATVEGFGKMGIPASMAYLTAITEFFGGLGVLVGVLARLSTLGLAIIMIVAVAKVHWANGFFLSGGPGPGFEYNLALFAMAVTVLVAGPGRLAIADWEAGLFGGSSTVPDARTQAEDDERRAAA